MGAISPLSNNKRSLTMKKIIALTIIVAMMSGCGNMQKLIEPKVIEKRVEVPVPAPFSWKDEFTGIRGAEKALAVAVVLGMSYFSYNRGIAKGADEFKGLLKGKNDENNALNNENNTLNQTLTTTRQELTSARAVAYQIQANYRTLAEKYQAALLKIEELSHNE
jgi:hypothetical protein